MVKVFYVVQRLSIIQGVVFQGCSLMQEGRFHYSLAAKIEITSNTIRL